MNVVWSPKSLRNLAVLSERAPVQEQGVLEVIKQFAARGFPDSGRPIPEHRKQRYISVPPQGVFYQVKGDDMIIIRIADSRRRKKPW